MSKKTIEFSKEEYFTLMKLVYLGNWMSEVYNEEDPNSDYLQLEKHILSQADQFGCSQLVEKFEDDQYSVTEEFEDSSEVFEIIEEYNEDNFWNELISKLTQRDFDNKFESMKTQMSEEEIEIEMDKIAKKYDKVFREKGLDALSV